MLSNIVAFAAFMSLATVFASLGVIIVVTEIIGGLDNDD